jgi:nickel-dependent lactate racemase
LIRAAPAALSSAKANFHAMEAVESARIKFGNFILNVVVAVAVAVVCELSRTEFE